MKKRRIVEATIARISFLLSLLGGCAPIGEMIQKTLLAWAALLIIVLGSSVLSGCVAGVIYGAMAADWAFHGFQAYKTVQLSTGGNVESNFTGLDISEDNKAALQKIKSIAVWPGSGKSLEGEITITEKLEHSGHYKVITPAQVKAALKKLNSEARLEDLTQREREDLYNQVLQAVAADAALVNMSGGSAAKANVWSFDRPQVVAKIQLQIYSRQKKC